MPHATDRWTADMVSALPDDGPVNPRCLTVVPCPITHRLGALLCRGFATWLVVAGPASAFMPATLDAQVSPLAVAGKWSGGATMVDFTDAPYCEWSGPMTLELRQEGAAVTGTVKSEFTVARRLRDVNLPCNPYSAREDPVQGTVSGSRIEFTIRTVAYRGTFTGDLMQGTFTAGALNRGGVRGCFQLTRSGALAECKPR